MPKPNKDEAKQDYLKRCTSELVQSGKTQQQAYAACNVSWNGERATRQVLNLARTVEMVEVGSINLAKNEASEVKHEFAITAYTGKELETWFGKLVIDVDGIGTKEKMPVLREHARDRVVGHGKSFKKNGSLYVTGEFSQATADAKEVLLLADEGYPCQASVAVWPLKVMELKDSQSKAVVNGREITGPAEIWTESKVGEVSFVSLGRDDDTAAIVLSAATDDVPVEIVTLTKLQEADIMPITIEQLQSEAPELLAQIKTAARADGALEERARVTEIIAADGDAGVTRKAIADGTAAVECFKLFFQAEKQKRADGLKNMAAQATPPQGVEEPSETNTGKPAHQQLAERARQLASEKGVGLEEATRMAFSENRELAKAWVPVTPN